MVSQGGFEGELGAGLRCHLDDHRESTALSGRLDHTYEAEEQHQDKDAWNQTHGASP